MMQKSERLMYRLLYLPERCAGFGQRTGCVLKRKTKAACEYEQVAELGIG